MIELRNINVFFNKNTKLELHVLKSINLVVREGEFITVIGGNGAGKSTLMNLLAGDILPTKGKILIDDQDVTKQSTESRASFVARVFQDPMVGTFANLTVEENMSLAFTRGKIRNMSLALNDSLRDIFKHALYELDMGLENRMKDKVSLLSGGQRQALSLIMSSLVGSKILLLDEHTAALDPKTQHKIMNITNKLVKNNKLTTLMITHSMSHALEYGDRIIMLYHGKIIKDISGNERKNASLDKLIQYFD